MAFLCDLISVHHTLHNLHKSMQWLVPASEGRNFGMQSKLAALDHLKGGASLQSGRDFDHILITCSMHTASEQKLT